MNLLLFLSKMIFVSGVLYCYYWFFLRNKKFHLYNRFFLLSIPLLAVGIPLMNIPLTGFLTTDTGTGIKLLRAVSVTGWEDAVVITAHKSWLHLVFSWQNMALALYALIVIIILFALLRSISYVIKLSRKYKYEKISEIKFYHTPEPGTPFSFLNNIFWNDKIDMNSKKGNQILRHELYHVKQKHTADILFIELLCTASWFNPFFHLIKKELKAVHEFLADQYAASATNNHDYAELLVWESVAIHPLNISNPFFNNQIKRRITMITQSKNTRFGYIRRVMALPLLSILFCAFGVKLNHPIASLPLFKNKPVTIVVDAGHGGIDAGTISSTGILEKDIALSISKKLQQLGKDYNVNVVMTRETDILPGNASTIKEGLLNRVNIAEKNKADLFISIHVDAAVNNDKDNGFSIYLINNNQYYQKSMLLGSALAEEIKKTHMIFPEKGITVLQSSPMPAVLVECGYITNKDDLAFITNEENQEKIARNILEGVVRYNAFTNHSQNNESPQKDGDTLTVQADSYIVKIQNGDSLIIKSIEDHSSDTTPPTREATNKVFTKVEIEAEYPGDQKAWSEYLNKNLHYPQEAINKEIKGTVLARFIVNLDGTLSDLKIIKSPSKILSEETIRVIKNSGNWIPASNKGQKVKAYKIQPVVYILEPQ
jgi:bla regulator protein blaR1